MLRIRQIVFAARDLERTVEQFQRELGLQVGYRDPLVAEFGLHNALLPLGDQFLEVVSPTRPDTAAGRHLQRHGDSAYMLILQTDDFDRDKQRLTDLGVRTVWQADYPDIRAVHLHPKDIGCAIVSIDQPSPPESWRWAGPHFREHISQHGAQRILECRIGALQPEAQAQRWSQVLGTKAPVGERIELQGSDLVFEPAESDLIRSYRIELSRTAAAPRQLTICGTRFELCAPA